MKCEKCKKEIKTKKIHHYFKNLHYHNKYDSYFDNTAHSYIDQKGFFCLCSKCRKNKNVSDLLNMPNYIPEEQYKQYMIKLITKEE